MRRVDWRSLVLFSLVGAMSAAVPGMFIFDKYVVQFHAARVPAHAIAG